MSERRPVAITVHWSDDTSESIIIGRADYRLYVGPLVQVDKQVLSGSEVVLTLTVVEPEAAPVQEPVS